jgi:hypothetical protein
MENESFGQTRMAICHERPYIKGFSAKEAEEEL